MTLPLYILFYSLYPRNILWRKVLFVSLYYTRHLVFFFDGEYEELHRDTVFIKVLGLICHIEGHGIDDKASVLEGAEHREGYSLAVCKD